MIHWRDEALILSYKRHGESAALLEVLSKDHGRHLGIVRGGGSRKQAPLLQAGHLVSIEFSARLEEHLGSFRIEPSRSFTADLMMNPKRLAGFQAIVAMIKFSMEERDPHPNLYQASLDWLNAPNTAQAYLDWEITLLKEAGFALDLERCAITGAKTELAYISPKSGRAVTKEAAGAWADRLLPHSPAFYTANASTKDILKALEVTEYFLTHWLARMINKSKLPKARARFISAIENGGSE